MEGKQLTKLEKQIEKIRGWQAEIAEKAYAVIAASTEAHYYDDDIDPNIITPDELEAAGGSVREAKAKKRLIRDLKKNRAEAPVYLTESREIVKGFEKMHSFKEASGGNTLNVAVFIQDRNSDPTIDRGSSYDVIDIIPEEQEFK